MSREILFRGKTAQNEWVYGFYVKHGECDWIYTGDIDKLNAYDNHYGTVIHQPISHLLTPGTVCQYTGLTDKNGSKIFEGDIVKIPDDEDEIYTIEWDNDTARFVILQRGSVMCDFDNYWGYEIEVIGNIFDNPELLDGNTE